ncbi:MAG: 3-oxoadipate enol-lactonase [Desulfobacterales bacterium]
MQMKVRDINVNFEVAGRESGPVVICSHCLAGNINIWDPQVKALEKDYRILRYDLRGHGQTSAPEGDYTMEMLADDAAALLDALEIEKAHFMGISLGGMIGQTLALSHPERLLSLVLCDTACSIPKDSGPLWEERISAARKNGMEALADGTLERWLSPEFQKNNPEVTGKIREIIKRTPVDGFAGCCRAISGFDVSGRLSSISLPTLVMVGENDPGTPVEASQEIRDKIRGSVLKVLPGAFHLSNTEAAGSFNSALADFLAGL